VPSTAAPLFENDPTAAGWGEPRSVDCRRVWERLLAGASTLLECATTEAEVSLTVADRSEPGAVVSGRRQQMLNGVLLGKSSKQLAIELAVAPSTVAAEVRFGLEALGVCASASRIPLALSLLVHAAHYPAVNRFVGRAGCTRFGTHCLVYRAPLAPLEHKLSPAVSAVVYQLALGLTHEEIAARRRTSRRTIANQLAQAFKILGVSGRAGVLSYLSLNVAS
jgi:DNA-binding NarL/FixJ family response regulator